MGRAFQKSLLITVCPNEHLSMLVMEGLPEHAIQRPFRFFKAFGEERIAKGDFAVRNNCCQEQFLH